MTYYVTIKFYDLNFLKFKFVVKKSFINFASYKRTFVKGSQFCIN